MVKSNFKGEWLGFIPNDWDQKKIKHIFKIKKIIAKSLGFEVISITQKGAKVKDIESGDGQLSMDYSKYQLVNKGDFLMNHMDLLTGFIDISNFNGVTSPDYRVFYLKDKNLFAKFFLYLFQHFYTSKIFYGYGRGSSKFGRWRLPSVEFLNFYIPIPNIKEQILISQYLDKKISQIDSLIKKSEKRIELLKEKKDAFIKNYVTKGIDSNIEFKDTGISYIGKIPNHWTLTRIKFVSEIINGFAFSSESFSNDNPIPVIRIGDINLPLDLEKSMKVSHDILSKYQEFCTRKNDILVAMTGGTIGKSILFSSDEISLINQRVCAFRSISKVDQKFLSLYINSLIFKLQVNLNCIGGAQPNIGKDELMNFHIVLPPLDEQKEIANIVYRKMSFLEKIIKKETNRIFLMNEYRKSLISSVVTGKIRITEDMI